jgi:hypothetical protein
MGKRIGVRNTTRRKRLGRGRRKLNLMATSSGPWVIVLLITIGILAVAAGLYFFAAPYVMGLMGIETGNAEPTPMVATPSPSPSPHLVQTTDLATLQKEIVLKQKYISDPLFSGGEVYFTGGTDEAGGPKMNNLYKYNVEDNTEEKIGDMGIENDDLFTPRVNDNWIVWLDHKRSGGGYIKAISRKGSGTPFVVKRYYTGKPDLQLSGDLVAWVERTGTSMDKLFVLDLTSRESAVLDVFKNSVFGTSDASMSGDELIWANLDPEQSGQDAGKTGLNGAIYSVRLDGMGGKPNIYRPITYVHDPITNGKVYAWIDSNHGPEANLYISIERGPSEKIDTGVLNYALGDEFVAYSKDNAIYVYFWDTKVKQCIIPDREQAMFLGVSENKVLWYDITVRERDILKYAPVS